MRQKKKRYLGQTLLFGEFVKKLFTNDKIRDKLTKVNNFQAWY
jgi:hypothetical protein